MDSAAARDPIRETSFWRAYFRRRHAVLFYSLLAMLIAIPGAASLGLPQSALKFLMALCLLAAIIPNVNKGRRTILFVAILSLIILRFVSERDDVPINFGPVLALYGLTGLLATAATLRFVLRSPHIDSETVYAALSTYLLAGVFFSVIYSAIEFTWPGSFTGPSAFDEASALYFSFVTLASLGYGDILPRSDLARGVATFEVVSGQLYLAVLVARLISAFGKIKTSD